MMLPQQETGVQPSDSTQASKGSKQKSNVGAASLTSSNGGVATEQQAQRCPRCDSLNTKFCYFNNYSMSQPRHFCKNCRRYWTKGGALRNVPVGGGCRKNKRLKHRDPSYLTAFGEADASGPSHILASISGCGLSGFNPSASSLIQDLAREGHRQFAISRFPGMHLYDKRFITDNEQSHSGGTPTQDLFALGPGSVSSSGHLLSPFDQSTFPCLSNYLKSDSQPLLFQPHQLPHELAPFYDSISLTPTILAPQLEQFDAVGGSQSSQHDSANGMASSVGGIESQLTLIHENVQLNGVPASHHEMRSHEDQAQQAGQASAIREEFDEENVEMNMAKNNGRAIVSSISDWDTGVRSALVQHRMVTSDSEAMFSMPSQVSESSLWNASWPEMHAALAGSAAAAAGAMLH